MDSSSSPCQMRERWPSTYSSSPPASYTAAREPLELTTGLPMEAGWLTYWVPLPENREMALAEQTSRSPSSTAKVSPREPP